MEAMKLRHDEREAAEAAERRAAELEIRARAGRARGACGSAGGATDPTGREQGR